MGKTCIVCQGAAQIYCKNDDAFLCAVCDEQVHSANVLARKHQRVKLCELCSASAASAFCMNDSAQLCACCDASSREGAAGRQQRVPVGEAACFDQGSGDQESHACPEGTEEDSMFAVPDVPLVPPGVEDFPEWNAISGPLDAKSLLGKEFEQDLDIFDMDPSWLDRLDMGFDDLTQSIIDGVVPEFNDGGLDVKQSTGGNSAAPKYSAFDDQVKAPKYSAFDDQVNLFAEHRPPAVEHIKVEERSRPAVSRSAHHSSRTLHQQQALAAAPTEWMPYGELVRQDIASFVPPSLRPVDPQTILDRAADRKLRLARYREKKKNRQYKKTIRYASRKAYAEVRPRVKGRFARKDEVAAMRAAGLLPAA